MDFCLRKFRKFIGDTSTEARFFKGILGYTPRGKSNPPISKNFRIRCSRPCVTEGLGTNLQKPIGL